MPEILLSLTSISGVGLLEHILLFLVIFSLGLLLLVSFFLLLGLGLLLLLENALELELLSFIIIDLLDSGSLS